MDSLGTLLFGDFVGMLLDDVADFFGLVEGIMIGLAKLVLALFDGIADRVRNVSAVWMGATVGCAECHDHKYDPYTQRDFYRLGAFFADSGDLELGGDLDLADVRGAQSNIDGVGVDDDPGAVRRGEALDAGVLALSGRPGGRRQSDDRGDEQHCETAL